MFKFSLFIGSFIFFIYSGLIPLLGFKIWSKYDGWIALSPIKALGSMLLGVILFLLYRQVQNDERDEM